MLSSKNMNDNCPIIIHDKSKNYVIKTYKKKNYLNFLQNIYNETIMSKHITLIISNYTI